MNTRIVQFLILGISVVAFILALKFAAQFLPTSNTATAAIRNVVMSI